MAMLPEDEARSLGVPVGLLRTAVIVASTMMIRQFMSESVEHMEMHAGLAVLKEESLLEAEEILPDAAAADPTSSGEPWLPCPVTLSVTEISRVVAATRSSVSTRLSEWCAAGLMRKDVRAMFFRPALFEGLRDSMRTPGDVRPTSILVRWFRRAAPGSRATRTSR